MAEKTNVSPILSEPLTASQRLRAFEDEHFGEDVVRVNDQIERGHGSAIALMKGPAREKYKALERLVVAEKKLSDCTGALAQARDEFAIALRAANASV